LADQRQTAGCRLKKAVVLLGLRSSSKCITLEFLEMMASPFLEEKKYFNRGFWFEFLAFSIYLVAFTTWNILFRDSSLAMFGGLWQSRITQIAVDSVDTFWKLLEGPVVGLLVSISLFTGFDATETDLKFCYG
jgi:hypothetical protein